MQIRRQRTAGAILAVALALFWTGAAPAAGPPSGSGDAVALFNGKNLDGWYIHIRHADKSDPSADPKKIFQVEDGVIHISGEEFGCLTTRQEYENYRLTVEFKWGEKKWPPRDKPGTPRDSGILYHCVGPDRVWPKSIECQIQEHDCGDFYLVGGTAITHDGQAFPRPNPAKKKAMITRIVKSEDAEKPRGEWNTVEVICDGDTVTHIVNGVVVNKGTGASLTKGKILLQSEGAEVYYRKVELRPLKGK